MRHCLTSVCITIFVSSLFHSCHGQTTIRLGSDYGGWTIPDGILTNKSICYCVGNGEDISFDLCLIEKYGCTVFSFDPTPRAIIHVNTVREKLKNNLLATTCHGVAYPNNPALLNNYFFYPLGLWDADEEVKFFLPKNPSHVSASIVNIQTTKDYFIASCKQLSTIMNELKHPAIDLLKIDIEGAEYAVLKNILRSNARPTILCIEFHEIAQQSIRETLEELRTSGYTLCHKHNKDYTVMYQPS